MIGPARRQRGYSLILVLWTVGLLALVEAYLTATAREHALLTSEAREAAELETAANGATQHAIFEFLDQSEARWEADGTAHTLRIGPAAVTVRLEDEANKVNPNLASAARLRMVLRQASVDPDLAATLAAAIVSWRTLPGGADPASDMARPDAAADGDIQAGGPFTRLDELGWVPGMTSEILARMRPYLTLFTDDDTDINATPGGTERVVSIVAIARGPDSAMYANRVIVRTNARRTGRRHEILMSERIWPGHDLTVTSEFTAAIR
jgi:general secretion pathway protein K